MWAQWRTWGHTLTSSSLPLEDPTAIVLAGQRAFLGLGAVAVAWALSLWPGRYRCGLGKLFQEGYVTCLLANKWQSWDLNPGPEFPACSSLSSVPPSPSLDI